MVGQSGTSWGCGFSKVYQILPEAEGAKVGYIKIIDESGEDYLYPAFYFVLMDLPHEVSCALGFNG